MALDVSLPSLVNAAGAFLFLLLGLAILWIARHERMGLLVGGFAATFGLAFVVQNLFVLDGPLPALALGASSAALTVASIAVSARLVRGLRRRATAILVLLGGGYTALFVVAASDDIANAGARGALLSTTLALVAFNVGAQSLALPVAAAACAYRETGRGEGSRRRALALFALSMGLLVAFLQGAILLPLTFAEPAASFVLAVRGILLLGIVPLALWIPTRGVSEPHLMTRTLLALVAAALAGLVFVLLAPGDFGSFGIVRTVGVALLVVAVVRYDLLGVPLPRVATNRGAVAAGTLATLFIVAQVAQNFLEAQYGLLLGGVIAGAFLFAAHPIQRAIEGTRTLTPTLAPDDRAARRRDIYATAVRAALADHTLTPEGERALAHLAEELGIGAGEAHDIRAAAAEAAKR